MASQFLADLHHEGGQRPGAGTAPAVTRVEPPAHAYDGTRCLVFFEPLEGAKGYDLWVSPYPDGRGALQLGKGWTAPGQLLAGLNAGADLYLFVVATFANGAATKPSPPFKINLRDMFPFK